MEVIQKIIDEIDFCLGEISTDGSMSAGHNGPYHHAESALRNSSHWLFTSAVLYVRTGREIYRESASRLSGYLLDPQHRPHGANWMQRNQPGRDFCNGVIGAAWTGEALWALSKAFDREDACALATEVFRGHLFNQELGLWHRWEVDGTTLSIDKTFNHQLWYAATAARLASIGAKFLQAECERFMDMLELHFIVERSGLIQHRISLNFVDRLFRSGTNLNKVAHVWKSLKARRKLFDVKKRDVGYHAFNLQAFAVLHHYFPEHRFWSSPSWRNALAYITGTDFAKEIAQPNQYAYPYNPVGFEIASVLNVFALSTTETCLQWLERQWEMLTNCDEHRYGDKVQDPLTARARFYECLGPLFMCKSDLL